MLGLLLLVLVFGQARKLYIIIIFGKLIRSNKFQKNFCFIF